MTKHKQILSDQIRMEGTNTTTNSGNAPMQVKEYRNGNLVCSAHPLLVHEIQEMHETIDKIEDYFVLRKKLLGLIVDNKYLSGVVTGVILLLVAYYTVL